MARSKAGNHDAPGLFDAPAPEQAQATVWAPLSFALRAASQKLKAAQTHQHLVLYY